jgi:hypothetical protein
MAAALYELFLLVLSIISSCSDRCRTTVNVWGDSIGAAVVERYTKAQFDKLDAEDLVAEDLVAEDLVAESGIDAVSLPEKGGVDNENYQGNEGDSMPLAPSNYEPTDGENTRF